MPDFLITPGLARSVRFVSDSTRPRRQMLRSAVEPTVFPLSKINLTARRRICRRLASPPPRIWRSGSDVTRIEQIVLP